MTYKFKTADDDDRYENRKKLENTKRYQGKFTPSKGLILELLYYNR